jgi:hypothetical protein
MFVSLVDNWFSPASDKKFAVDNDGRWTTEDLEAMNSAGYLY